MNHFCADQMSDPLPLNKSKQEYSDASSTSGGFHSDEEVILASNRPKKRAGRRVFKETRHPIFRGVRRRNGNKWVCELREPNKKTRIWLGTYPTSDMAARAHDVAALALRGKSACLNFADSSWRLPVPTSTDAKEIRRVASEAAEMFRPQEFGGNYNTTVIQNSICEEDYSEACSEERKSTDFQGSVASYVDEEEVFDMPRLLAEMAQGLLLSPPHFRGDIDTDRNRLENDFDMSLWSY